MHDARCHTGNAFNDVKNYFKIQEEVKLEKEKPRTRKIYKTKKHISEKPICWIFCENCGVPIQKHKRPNNLCNLCARKLAIKKIKGPGNCSMCGKFNTERDQNARGKSDCSCSKDWFTKHNRSERMREQAGEVGKKFGRLALIAYNKSEKHREQVRELGKKVGFKNLIKYNVSDEHRETARRVRKHIYHVILKMIQTLKRTNLVIAEFHLVLQPLHQAFKKKMAS